MASYNAGIVTAYGAAVRGGYTGTYEQFCAQQANYAQTAADVEQAKQDAQAAVQQAQDIADSIPEDYTELTEEVSNLKDDLTKTENIIADKIGFNYSLEWTTGKYLYKASGGLLDYANCAVTNYVKVFQGQNIQVNLYAMGDNDCAVCFYEGESKTYVYDSSHYVFSAGTKAITVPFDGYARFCTNTNRVSTTNAYVKNDGAYEERITALEDKDALITEPYFPSGNEVYTGSAREFNPTTPKISHTYKGDVTPQKRFLCLSFDDLRASDMSMMIPLLNKYGFTAGFNRVQYSTFTDTMQKNINEVLFSGMELGDHTFLHMACPFTDPYFNGQDPTSLDGNQVEFPTNDQLRNDVGDGKNVFGRSLTDIAEGMSTAYGSLTDAQCQTFREKYSVYASSDLGVLLDTLSNKYLGTTGTSKGSWDSVSGKYTSGIYTGCETSANHEVWERIIRIIEIMYKEQYGVNQRIKVWSKPGSGYPGLHFDSYYYDAEKTKRNNFYAKFHSSLTGEERSFTDVLRSYGYIINSDYDYPTRNDGLTRKANTAVPVYFNERVSQKDVFFSSLYAEMPISYSSIYTDYPETFFSGSKSKIAQMYDANGSFRTFIESIRKTMANGRIASLHADTVDNYSSRVFYESLFEFCKRTGIEVINPSQAYDVAFNHPVTSGNLLCNPLFENLVNVGIPDAENGATTPDGFVADPACTRTTESDGTPVFVIPNNQVLDQYGIPYGKLLFSGDFKGNDSVTVYGIKNNSPSDLSVSQLTTLGSASFNSNDYVHKEIEFTLPNNPVGAWEQQFEGYGDKFIGIRIYFHGHLMAKNLGLELVS